MFVCTTGTSWSQDRSEAALPSPDIAIKLGGFDAYMHNVLWDWEIPGVGVGIILKEHVTGFTKRSASGSYFYRRK